MENAIGMTVLMMFVGSIGFFSLLQARDRARLQAQEDAARLRRLTDIAIARRQAEYELELADRAIADADALIAEIKAETAETKRVTLPIDCYSALMIAFTADVKGKKRRFRVDDYYFDTHTFRVWWLDTNKSGRLPVNSINNAEYLFFDDEHGASVENLIYNTYHEGPLPVDFWPQDVCVRSMEGYDLFEVAEQYKWDITFTKPTEDLRA